MSVSLQLSWGSFGSSSVHLLFVLWRRLVGWNQVPKRIRVPPPGHPLILNQVSKRIAAAWALPGRPLILSVWLQVPCLIAEDDRVCSALLLPHPGLLELEHLPGGILL